MGVGTPNDLLEAVARGVDMFDCVMPTRNGRNALAFTDEGPLRLRNAKHTEDTRPIQEGCPCIACRRHSRGYIRHLFQANEMLGPILLSICNLTYYQRLMQGHSAIDRARQLRRIQSRKTGRLGKEIEPTEQIPQAPLLLGWTYLQTLRRQVPKVPFPLLA